MPRACGPWSSRRVAGGRSSRRRPWTSRSPCGSTSGSSRRAPDRGGSSTSPCADTGSRPGWHHVYLGSPDAETIDVPVLVVGTTVTHGIISDIDDTVLSTSLPRPMIAAWNTFMRSEGARRPVPGMATMYRELLASQPDAPVVYLSTGAWNTAPLLTRFLRRSGFPAGPMLLTDWGPTNTGWFRSGQEHKKAQLHRLARELPHVKWLLVGDDGQHDPKIYTEFATRRADRVRGIAMRELSPGEQVLVARRPRRQRRHRARAHRRARGARGPGTGRLRAGPPGALDLE